MITHGGLISLWVGTGWRGALITGPSGSGKSDLALRTLGLGCALVADDQVEVWRSGGAIYGRAPDVLAGLIEIRGRGIERIACRAFSRIDLICACRASGEIERMPEDAVESFLGIPVPRLELAPWEASAPAKLLHVLMALGSGPETA